MSTWLYTHRRAVINQGLAVIFRSNHTNTGRLYGCYFAVINDLTQVEDPKKTTSET